MAIEDVIPVGQGPSKFGRASPILVFGVLLLVVYFIADILPLNFNPVIALVAAIFFIFIGVIHSIFKEDEKKYYP